MHFSVKLSNSFSRNLFKPFHCYKSKEFYLTSKNSEIEGSLVNSELFYCVKLVSVIRNLDVIKM